MSLRADAPVFVPSFSAPPSPNNDSTKAANNEKPPRHERRRRRRRRNGQRSGGSNLQQRKTKSSHTRLEEGGESCRTNHGSRTRRQRGKRGSRKNKGPQQAHSSMMAHHDENDYDNHAPNDQATIFIESSSRFPPLHSNGAGTAIEAQEERQEWSRMARKAHEKQLVQELEKESKHTNTLQNDNVVLTRLVQQQPPQEIVQTLSTTTLSDDNHQASKSQATQEAITNSTTRSSPKWDMDKLRTRWWQILKEKKLQQEKEQELLQQQMMSERSSLEIDESCSSSLSLTSNDDESDSYSSSSVSSSGSSVDHFNLNAHGPYPLHQAIINNDANTIQRWLNQHNEAPSIQSRASLVKDLGFPSHDMKESIIVSLKQYKLSALELAIFLDRPHLVRLLVPKEHFGGKGNRKNVKTATEQDWQESDNNATPFMLACELGHDGCIKVLLAHLDNVVILLDHETISGNTALHYACMAGAPAFTLRLLVLGGRFKDRHLQRILSCKNTKGQTPLHLACLKGHEHLVQVLLLECKTSLVSKILSILDCEGQTPLLSAISAQHAHVVMSLLMWRGNQSSQLYGTSPPTRQNYQRQYEQVASTAKTQQHKSHCPLTWAVRRGSMDMICLLLEFNDPFLAACGNGLYNLTSALHAAIQTHHSHRSEMVRVLVEAGANPCIGIDGTTQQPKSNRSSTENSNNTAISIAACQENGDLNVLIAMLDAHANLCSTRNKARRQDAKLQRQPNSYFEAIESKETLQTNVALCDALVKSLYYGWCRQNDHCLDSSVILMKRGACLTLPAYSRLKRNMAARQLLPPSLQDGGDKEGLFLYEASCAHYGKPGSVLKKNVTAGYVASSELRFWSSVFLRSSSWKTDEVGDIHCGWIKAERNIQEKKPRASKRIECDVWADVVLVAGEERFPVHSELVSLKSAKLAAAIRFASMNSESADADKKEPLPVHVNLSPKMCKWMLQHIYHGSIFCGWDMDDLSCCQELLELATIAEEYLCPSLVCECEMRLLAKNPFKCFCWSCCTSIATHTVQHNVETSSTIPRANCLYRVRGPSRLLRAGVVLDTVAVCQQLGTFGNEAENMIKFIPLDKVPSNEVHSSNKSLSHNMSGWGSAIAPFQCIMEASIHVILRDFPRVLRTETYLGHVHSMLQELEAEGNPERSDHSIHHWEPQTMLLQMCLEELASSPLLNMRHEWTKKHPSPSTKGHEILKQTAHRDS